MTTPRISVVMPVRNGLPYIREAVDSILGQTVQDFEFVIVDDVSTDGTRDYLKELAAADPRVRPVFSDEPLGLSRVSNWCLAHAQGEYVARQDADDIAEKTRIEQQVRFLDAHPEVGLLGTGVRYIDKNGEPRGVPREVPCTDAEIRWAMLFENTFSHTTIMLRQSALKACGLSYDEALTYCEDYDLWRRFMEHTRAANLPAPLVRYRAHDGQYCRSLKPAERDQVVLMVQQNLARIGMAVDPADAERLRNLYLSSMPFAGPRDVADAARLVQGLALLISRQGLSGGPKVRLVARVVGRVMTAMGAKQAYGLLDPSIRRAILSDWPWFVLMFPFLRLSRLPGEWLGQMRET